MWVLILLGGHGAGRLSAAVTGYKTEQICKDIGDDYVKRAIKKVGASGGYICIPGPSQPEKTSAGWVGAVSN